MTPRTDIRFNLHLVPNSNRVGWGLLSYTINSQGVPDARLIAHGVCDLDDFDMSGLDAAVHVLLRAVEARA